MISIGVFAGLSGLSAKALRHYHDRGLLVPAHVDPQTGYRTYDIDQLEDAARIAVLRQADMPLDRIARLLESPDRSDDLLDAYRQELAAERSRADRALDLARTALCADASAVERRGPAEAFVAVAVPAPVLSTGEPDGSARRASRRAGTPGRSAALRPVAVVVLCVPVQAFVEEYVFRGVLTLAIGARFARRGAAVAVPVVVTSVLFAAVHPNPDPALMALVLVGGVGYAVLTHLTGGLEAGSAAHTVWNAGPLVAAGVLGMAPSAMSGAQVALAALGEIALIALLALVARADKAAADDPVSPGRA